MSWVEDHLIKGMVDKAVHALATDGEFDVKGIGKVIYTGTRLDIEADDSLLRKVHEAAAAEKHRRMGHGTWDGKMGYERNRTHSTGDGGS